MSRIELYWKLLAVVGILIVAAGGWLLLPKMRAQLALAQSQARWSAAQPAHYSYTLQVSCFCPIEYVRPIVVEVQAGTLILARYRDDSAPVPPAMVARYGTIEQLFALLQAAIWQPGSRLSVRYDPKLGYPTQASIDPIPNAIDDEFAFTVEAFERLP